MKTKFGVSYNVFNAEEHLIPSIENIRNSVDYINIVVQYTSNLNNPATEQLRDTIKEIEQRGLVEKIVEYQPSPLPPQQNEHQKRVVGLKHARAAGVTYFTTMDADEYFLPDQYNEAKRFIVNNDIAYTAAPTFLHIRRPVYRSAKPDSTDICFFARIDGTATIPFGARFPANVDPTRRITGSGDKFYFFGERELAMMHMNLVRQDKLQSKLANTSSSANTEFIQRVLQAYNTWEPGKLLYFPNKPPMEIVEVPDYFSIDYLFKK